MKYKSLIGILIYYLMNIALINLVFFSEPRMQFGAVILYLLVSALSLSPIGEEFLCLLANAEKIKRYDMKLKIVPLAEIVLTKTVDYIPSMVKDVRIRLINDPAPMAYAIGRKTICITEGLLRLPDEVISGVLAHEMGHLALRHTTWQLLIGGSNFFISFFVMLIKAVMNLLSVIAALSIFGDGNKIISIFVTILTFAANLLTRLWIRISMFFLCWTKRENEFEADAFAYEIGYGYQLASALDQIHSPESSTLISALLSTHPSNNERIARLQELGVHYYLY